MTDKHHTSFANQVWSALGNNQIPGDTRAQEQQKEAIQSLSERDLQILNEISKGITTYQAAENLQMSTRTLRNKIYSICLQLKVNTPIEAVILVEREKTKQATATKSPLTREELELLAEIATGVTTEVAARNLEISARKLRKRVRNICDIIGVNTPIEAVVWAARHDLI